MTGPDKEALRGALHECLRRTDAARRDEWSGRIRAHLRASAVWREARTVMLFAAMNYEPCLLPLLESAPEKRFLFPAMERERIVPRAVLSAGELTVSAGGIREPSADCTLVCAEEVDLVLVPGLGFARDGTRLGRGRGHYDRFLAALPARCVRCGVCFGCQVCSALPAAAHDVPVSLLLTEEGLAAAAPC